MSHVTLTYIFRPVTSHLPTDIYIQNGYAFAADLLM
jgi:hypothetical protein